MPKPNLTALTGGYRKTPVLQIGADIYCNSQFNREGGNRSLCPFFPLKRYSNATGRGQTLGGPPSITRSAGWVAASGTL